MTPPKPNKPETPKTPETHAVDAAGTPASPQAEAASKTDKSGGAREGRRVLSVSIPERLGRQVKLLCSVTGTSAQELVESALRRAVNKQLAGALESIKADVEG